MSRSSLSGTDCLLSLLSVSSCQARSARDVTWTVCQTVNCHVSVYLAPPHHQLHLHVLHGAVIQGLQVVTGRSWDGQFVRRSTVTCLTSEGGESHQGRPVNVLARVQVVVQVSTVASLDVRSILVHVEDLTRVPLV